MCVEGASLVHTQATSQIESDKLRIFVIWLPRYPGDNRTAAIAATMNVPDSRSMHFWDTNASLSKHYGLILGLPKGKQFAWDTYMTFAPDVLWDHSPPKPNDWMHQMSDLGDNHPRWLDEERFRESVESLLAAGST